MPVLTRRKRSLATTHMWENLQRTQDGTVWAWYRLGPHSWSLKSVSEREAMWSAQLSAWSSLAGYRVRLRLSSVPFPTMKWAEHYHETNGHDRSDDGWTNFLVSQQKRINQVGVSRPFRAVGVRLKTRLAEEDWNVMVETGECPLAEFGRERRDVDSLMRDPGFTKLTENEDNRLTERELWWLMHRSVTGGAFQPPREGLSLEGGWGPSDMDEFTGAVETWKEPEDASITVQVVRDGKKEQRHVVVRDLIRAGVAERASAERDRLPWLATLDIFSFPVEIVATLDIIEGKRLEKTMEAKQLRAAYIRKHTVESGRLATQSQERAIAQAGRAYDQVTTGSDEEATRVYGSIRFAVSGETEDEALDRAQVLAEYYTTKQKMQLIERRRGMYGRYREFIPGEPITQGKVDVERMTARFFATGWPGAAAGVGDDVGTYSGYVTGIAKRAVMIDDHTPTLRHERASNFIVTGTLGSGKTQWLAFRAAINAVLQRMTLFNDPDGHAANLARIPMLTPITQVINLTEGNATPGMLNPYAMLPDPPRSDYETEEEWVEEKRKLYMQRRQLVADTVLKFVHPTVARSGGARGHILSALSTVGADYGHSPWEIVDVLAGNDETRALAKEIAEAANSPAGMLAFGSESQREIDSALNYALAMLTIITSPGLDTPDPAKDEEEWTISEQLSVPVRMLAQFFGSRLLFTADRDQLKVGIFDELGIYLAVKAAADGVNRLVRTSRANRIAVGLGTQDASDLKDLRIQNWLTRKYLGRVESEEEGLASLKLGGLTLNEGYQTSVMQNLSEASPGQFVIVDERKRAEVFQADMGWWPEFMTAMQRKRPEIRDTQWLPGTALI